MKNLELTAIYDREKFRFANADGDVLISLLITQDEKTISAKGPDLADGFCNGEAYRFFGAWTKYVNKRTGEEEKQFFYKTCVKCAPFGRHGVVKYLQRAPGIGCSIAKRLWDVFGSDAVSQLRELGKSEEARCLVDRIQGLSVETAKSASAYLQREFALEACVIDLMDLLDGQGLPKKAVQKCLEEWGNQAAAFIRKNPYLLMRFRGIGFKRCDQLYMSLRLPPGRLRRQALCGWYGVAQEHQQDGSTWVERDVAVGSIRRNIGGADIRVYDAILLALRGRILNAKWTQGRNGSLSWDGTHGWLADSRKAKDEQELACLIADAMTEG